MAERRRSIKVTLLLFLILSAIHYSAGEAEEMQKSIEMSDKTVFLKKTFNPLSLVIATSALYLGDVLFWVGFASVSLKYIKIFSASIDDFGEYEIMSRPRIRSQNLYL